MKFILSTAQAIADQVGIENMICEGGAGRLRDKNAPQMFGPYEGIEAAKNDPSLAFPAYVPEIGEQYFALAKRGDWFMGNWAEDKFGPYEAKQNALMLGAAKKRGLVPGIFGWPSFDPVVNATYGKAFGRIVGSSVSVLWPAYYPQKGSKAWMATDFIHMSYLISETAKLADQVSSQKKMIGFVGSPQDHGGNNFALEMLEEQIRFVHAHQTVEVFAMWSDANPAKPEDQHRVKHTIAAAVFANKLINKLVSQ